MRILYTKAFFLFLTIVTQVTAAPPPTNISIYQNTVSGHSLPFISHQGPGEFDNTLAMNTGYQPILHLRKVIETVSGRKLDYFKKWDPRGEAHITTITPVEYHRHLKPFLSMGDIDSIARKQNIQLSDVQILGIGSGRKIIDGLLEETFFIIVDSANLRRIRYSVYQAYVRRGGHPRAWNPNIFYPHITIGYTKRDLHESDGVFKNVQHSLDPRFRLIVR